MLSTLRHPHSLVLVFVLGATLWPSSWAASAEPAVVRELAAPVTHVRSFTLPRPATHVAVHWSGGADARVRVAFSRDGTHFSRAERVALDEPAGASPDGESYGAIMLARGARSVRVETDRPLRRLAVLALSERGTVSDRSLLGSPAPTSPLQPLIIPRAAWGANESYRFNPTGAEVAPPTFWPLQKIIIHHTVTPNDDPNPVATLRAIYYYHAVERHWGDIAYNFLIDERGDIYQGRYSGQNDTGIATGEDQAGDVVAGMHTQDFDPGTIGIALLGTFTSQDATPAARDALVRLLAWEAERHGLAPQGAATYTNPATGKQTVFPNIAGHRDVGFTECPGGAFYATLPQLRAEIAARLAGATPDFVLTASPLRRATRAGLSVSYQIAAGGLAGFRSRVTLSVIGAPTGVHASFHPASAAIGRAIRLTLHTARSTLRGTYLLTVVARSGNIVHSTPLTLVIGFPIPAPKRAAGG